jgi:hypothetical protein
MWAMTKGLDGMEGNGWNFFLSLSYHIVSSFAIGCLDSPYYCHYRRSISAPNLLLSWAILGLFQFSLVLTSYLSLIEGEFEKFKT